MKKYIIIFFLSFFTNCLTGNVYKLAFPGNKEPLAENVQSIEIKGDQFLLTLKNDRKTNKICFPLKIQNFYSYIEPGYEVECNSEKSKPLTHLKEIPHNAFPFSAKKIVLLYPKFLDKSNHYTNQEFTDVSILIDSVHFSPEKNLYYLKNKSGQCITILRDDRMKDGHTSYTASNSESPYCAGIRDLMPIEFELIDGSLFVLEFQSNGKKLFFKWDADTLPNSQRKLIVRPVISFEEEVNYLYTLLFILTVPIDLVTSPFQIIYLFISVTGISVR